MKTNLDARRKVPQCRSLDENRLDCDSLGQVTHVDFSSIDNVEFADFYESSVVSHTSKRCEKLLFSQRVQDVVDAFAFRVDADHLFERCVAGVANVLSLQQWKFLQQKVFLFFRADCCVNLKSVVERNVKRCQANPSGS